MKIDNYKKWIANNKDRYLEICRKSRNKHQVKYRENKRKKYQLNIEKERERSRIYYYKNRDKVLNRQKGFRNIFGYTPEKLIQEAYELNIKKYGTLTCYLCLKKIKFGDDNIEHKIPVSRWIKDNFNGSPHSVNNLGVAHKKCNCLKGSRTPEEYKQELKKIELLHNESN